MAYFYTIDPNGFYSDDYPGVMNSAIEAGAVMHPISDNDYNAFFNPPDGYYGVFDSTGPHLEPIPAVDWLAVNTDEKESRKLAAMATVAVITAKLNMGRTLTQAEKDKMNAVLDYCDALDALDLSGETVDWPVAP